MIYNINVYTLSPGRVPRFPCPRHGTRVLYLPFIFRIKCRLANFSVIAVYSRSTTIPCHQRQMYNILPMAYEYFTRYFVPPPHIKHRIHNSGIRMFKSNILISFDINAYAGHRVGAAATGVQQYGNFGIIIKNNTISFAF